ncbi:MAG: hypothetical protein M1830_001954 [Pleopsidium flavum]|nr:MAG: hypothetical protein M1830_001954 [Pleopsidium flavum]
MAANKPPPPKPLVLSLASPLDFLDYILAHHTFPTTLIICSTREVFLQHLLTSIHDTHSQRPPPSQSSAQSPPSSPPTTNAPPPKQSPQPPKQPHPLLLPPTLQTLASTTSITLAFTPTLTHLRAYLSTYTAPQSPSSHLQSINPLKPPQPPLSSSSSSSPPKSRHPLLALLNPLELHRSTPHFSAQGLSRTFAAAVEVARREGMGVLVCECPVPLENQVDEDVEVRDDEEGEEEVGRREGRDIGNGNGNGDRSGSGGGDPWEARVPLLNGTVRFGGEERVWAGRSVSCRRVVERWCVFAGSEGDEGVGAA